MSKTHFQPKAPHLSSLQFWLWRDMNRSSQSAGGEDAAQAQAFSARAQALRDQLEFLLGGGLSEGAETALAALAEEDMVNFCIMVDLAESIEMAGVTPLTDDAGVALANFLEHEPWHSLAVDNDITVALALLGALGSEPSDQPWYRSAPGFANFAAQLLDRVNKEQLLRLVGEYNELARRNNLALQPDVRSVLQTFIESAAHRVGLPVPKLS